MKKDQVFDVFCKVVMEILPEVKKEQITEDQQLVNLGANSIDRSEIMMQSMMELKIKAPLVECAKLKKIGDIVEFFQSKSNG